MMRSIWSFAGVVACLPLFACGGRTATDIDAAPTEPGRPSPSPSPGPDPIAPASPGYPDDWTSHGGACSSALEIVDCNTFAGVGRYKAPLAELDAEGNEVLYLGVYQTTDGGHGQGHVVGAATIFDTRIAPHTLVLTSYEAVSWTVLTSHSSGLRRVITSGHYEQHVTTEGANVKVEHKGSTPSSCGYSYPYNGEGCDTELALESAAGWAGAPVAEMAGCYQASTFLVNDSYDDCSHVPIPNGEASNNEWHELEFAADTTTSDCQGGRRFVRFSEKYGKWVGAELCSTTSYKLYLAETPDAVFAPIADRSGHGQDHCELLNDNFSLPNDDEITSGGCANCAAEAYRPWSWPGSVPVYVRSKVGERFERQIWSHSDGPNGPMSSLMTSSRYSCGVQIP